MQGYSSTRIVFFRCHANGFNPYTSNPFQYLLSSDFVKTGIREICSSNSRIVLDRNIGDSAAMVSVKFPGDRTILDTNLQTKIGENNM